ncbi:MAG: hypothetical protein ACRD36_01205, partial [Candidatus Acidiferrum sp.]
MNGTRRVAGLAIAAVLCLMVAGAASAQDTGGKQPYTIAEYNAYQACAAEKNPTALVKCLDDFVSKYPNSNLLLYIYPLYMRAYGQLKNYPKLIETTDKLVALGDKIDVATRFNAYYAHIQAYNGLISSDKTAAQDPKLAKSAQDTAVTAMKALDDVKKPENVTEDAWAAQKKQILTFLNGIAAQASLVQKDCASGINFYKAVLTLNPDDAVTAYSLGKAYLACTPPQTMDAFWSFARAVTAKGATEQQSKQVKTYLRKVIANYQGGAVCEDLTDAELNELLQLAKSSADRPASYTLPASADLDAARKDMTIASVLADVKAGGDKAKITWLASCGLEFPEVPAKVIEIVPGDTIVFKLAFVTSEAEFEAATTANMDIKVAGQPDAARVEKDSAIHFTGTLVSYDPDPAFMVHWDKA